MADHDPRCKCLRCTRPYAHDVDIEYPGDALLAGNRTSSFARHILGDQCTHY
jgi:hypothetical protein